MENNSTGRNYGFLGSKWKELWEATVKNKDWKELRKATGRICGEQLKGPVGSNWKERWEATGRNFVKPLEGILERN